MSFEWTAKILIFGKDGKVSHEFVVSCWEHTKHAATVEFHRMAQEANTALKGEYWKVVDIH